MLYVIKRALIGKPDTFASPQATSLWPFVRLYLGLGRSRWCVELHYGVVLKDQMDLNTRFGQ